MILLVIGVLVLVYGFILCICAAAARADRAMGIK